MTWLKTYNSSSPFAQLGRINLDLVSWFDGSNGAGGFGVYATVGAGSVSGTKLVTPGFPYATAADAVAAIDDLILNGS